jgi:hypothetical protein
MAMIPLTYATALACDVFLIFFSRFSSQSLSGQTERRTSMYDGSNDAVFWGVSLMYACTKRSGIPNKTPKSRPLRKFEAKTKKLNNF